ncbi:glycosyltransferase [Olsenella sp. AM30-3LB]|nr:glycosyltransferase [Olsenella sp. AM30-3LB]
MDPLVSVVMPVCNSEPYLCDSIGSVLKQSMTNFELIVVDDASADRSVEIIDEMAAADPRITFISLKENRGVAEARNIALTSARSLRRLSRQRRLLGVAEARKATKCNGGNQVPPVRVLVSDAF